MHRIDAKLLIESINNSHREKLCFDDSWDFSIDRYNFKKVNDDNVEVSFLFDANLRRQEDGEIVEEVPTEHTEEFQPYETDLDIILDLLSLDTGFGLRIKKDSYLFSSYPLNGSGVATRDNDIPPQSISVKVRDVIGVQKRFQKIIDKRRKLERVINGLRFYRYSLFSDELGEKTQKLWSVIEQMYGEQKGKLLSNDELKVIKDFLKKWTGLDQRKKDVLFQRIANTTEKSLIDVLSERIELMNRQGIISSDETKEMLKVWHSKRSQPAHGAIMPKREEGLDLLLWEMESTVESLLYGELYPKMIHYIIFKKTDLNKSFVQRQGKLLSRLENHYWTLPMRHDEIELYNKHLPHELRNQDSIVFMISHNLVIKISKSGSEKINIEALDDHLKKIISTIMNKLNQTNNIQ